MSAEVLAHPPHSAANARTASSTGSRLELAQHVMAILNRLDRVQWPVEQRRQLVLLAPGGERRHDLIEMQIRKELGHARRRFDNSRVAVEQDASECGRRA